MRAGWRGSGATWPGLACPSFRKDHDTTVGRGKRIPERIQVFKNGGCPKRISPSGVMRALFFQPTQLVDQRIEENTQMEFAFKRLPALRSVLAAGVIAATFVVQPAVAQSPAPLSKSCRQRLAAHDREYKPKYEENGRYVESIKGQYRKLCDFGRKNRTPQQDLAGLEVLRRAGCLSEKDEIYTDTVNGLETYRKFTESNCRAAAAQER